MLEKTTLWKEYFPKFTESTDPAIQLLMDSAILKELPADQIVFYPGAVCENYLLMLEGSIRAQLISENGREVSLYTVRSGDSCVLTTSCLLGNERYPAEGITEDKVKAFLFTAKDFQLAIHNSLFFRNFVFNNFAHRLANIIARMEDVVFGAIDKRLAIVLLKSSNNTIKKTHQELASELGTAREVVSRHLKRFEAYGWVELARGSITVNDFDSLTQLTNIK
ncbi:MAG: Crp/Fnr family transcriptional regulator [Methylococcales bacterium]